MSFGEVVALSFVGVFLGERAAVVLARIVNDAASRIIPRGQARASVGT
jgi:hypothetical protein